MDHAKRLSLMYLAGMQGECASGNPCDPLFCKNQIGGQNQCHNARCRYVLGYERSETQELFTTLYQYLGSFKFRVLQCLFYLSFGCLTLSDGGPPPKTWPYDMEGWATEREGKELSLPIVTDVMVFRCLHFGIGCTRII